MYFDYNMTSQKIQIQFNHQAVGMDGFTVEVRANVSASFSYESNPYGLEGDHPYNGHQSGWTMQDLEWSNIEIDNMLDQPERPGDLRDSEKLPFKWMKQLEKIATEQIYEEFENQN